MHLGLWLIFYWVGFLFFRLSCTSGLHPLNRHEFEQTPREVCSVEDMEGWHTAVHAVATEQLQKPGSSWILNAQQFSSSWCFYRKWPQGSRTSCCIAFLPLQFPCYFLLEYCWFLMLFVSGFQEPSSVMLIHRCLFYFGFFFCLQMIRLCS